MTTDPRLSLDPAHAQREASATLAAQVEAARAEEAGLSISDYRDRQAAALGGMTVEQLRGWREVQATGRPGTLADYYRLHDRDKHGRLLAKP